MLVESKALDDICTATQYLVFGNARTLGIHDRISSSFSGKARMTAACHSDGVTYPRSFD